MDVRRVRLPGVVLAAGRSIRMGTPKALLPRPTGERFCSHVVATLLAADVSPIVVVARPGDHELTRLLAEFSGDEVRVATNPAPDRGQLSSLQQGLASLPPAAPAAVITLVDVPLASAASVARLVAAWRASRAPLVRPVRHGRHGHPIVVSRSAIEDLCRADETMTARGVLARFVARSVEVPVGAEEVFDDVDTPDEYARLLERLRRHS